MEQTTWNNSDTKIFEDQQFKAIDFSKASLDGFSFTCCTFQNCNFFETGFKNAIFSDCVFDTCQLTLVCLGNSRLQNIDFVDSKLIGLEFFTCDHSLLFAISVKNCILQSCNFSDLEMNKTSFGKSIVEKCFFTNTVLVEADFSGCDLSQTRFHNVDLRKANFKHAKNYEINPLVNNVAQAKFSFPEAINLLKGLGVKIVE